MATPYLRKTKDFNPGNCAVTYILNIIGGKWKPVLLHLIRSDTHRFSELQRAFPEVSKQTLINQLRELEIDGVIERRAFPEMPPRVEYHLTPFGETLIPILEAMKAWVREHKRATGEAAQSAGVTDAVAPSGTAAEAAVVANPS